MKTLMPTLLLAIACATAGAQQQGGAPAPPSLPVVEIANLRVEFVDAPSGTPRQVLLSVAEMYKRRVLVKNSDGSMNGPLLNVNDCQGGFLVYDTPEYVQTFKTALATAAAAVPKARADEPLRIATYKPRNVDVNRLASSLAPLRRQVLVPGAPPTLQGEFQPNMTFQSNPALIVMQDTSEHVDRMLALLEQVDQAPPQFLLQCVVLEASDEAVEGTGLPPELLDNLKKLLPFAGFRPVGTALLRASIEAGQEQDLSGALDTGDVFQIKLLPGGVDLPNRRISLQRLRFECGDQAFETSTVMGLDEYTVIGGAGFVPMLVVLRVASLPH